MKSITARALLHACAVVAGLAAICALVWYVGPLVAIAGVVPLDGAPARGLTVAAIILLALLIGAARALRERSANGKLLDGIAATAAADSASAGASRAGPAAAAGSAEVALLGELFEQAMTLLKRRGAQRAWRGWFSSAPYVYELPWYVIIGAPGAGKTTALSNSGLEFPLEAQLGGKRVRGIGGTRNCDWWFTSDAVLLDTAGRYTTQDSDRAADASAWRGFLDLLARYRPGRPLNGVLLTLSAADLLNPDADKRREHALALRERIAELNSRFAIRLPIYTLITKTDLLAGFAEFFADFDKDERAQIWGVTFPFAAEAGAQDPLTRVAGDLAALEGRLNDHLVERLQAEHDLGRRAAIYAFPQQWRVLHETLLELLPLIYGDAPGETSEAHPLLRGVYFTSATQEGTPIDRAIGSVARTLGLTARLVPALRSTAKTFFVTRLLRDVVLSEAGLAGVNLRWQRRRGALRWAWRAAVGAVAVLALGLTGFAYNHGRARLAEAEGGVSALERSVVAAHGSAPTDLVALLPALQSLQGLAGQTAGSSASAADSRWRMALEPLLGPGATLAAVAGDAYRGLLKDAMLPRIAARLEQRLRAGSREHLERLYEDLKAYQMLFSGRHFDAAALRAFLGADWTSSLPASSDERDALRRHLDALLAGGEVGAPSQADPRVVASARALLGNVPLAQRAYQRLQQEDPGAPPFNLDTVTGDSGSRLFVRAGSASLERGIPALYTRAVYERGFNLRTQDALKQLASEQGWVLGVSAATALEPSAQTALIADVDQLYVADYVRRWDALVNDLRLAPVPTLAASAEQAQRLGHTQSPLQTLLRAITRELGVAPSGPASPTPSADEPLIDPRFGALRQYVAGSSLPDTLATLGRLGTYLAAVDDAAQRHTLPPSSEVLHELALAAPRAPEPVHAMLAQLAQTGATLSFAALRAPLSKQVADELGPACTRATGHRYPFARDVADEVPRAAFIQTFAADGALDGFFQRSLAPYVDTAAHPWAYRSGDAADGLQAFQNAQAIRNGFFHDGGRTLGTTLEFRLLELDPAMRQLTLLVDGQALHFGRDQKPTQALQWPLAEAGSSPGVRLQTSWVAGGGADFPFDGPWGLLHLFDRARVEPGATPDRLAVVFDVEGHKARFEVHSSAPVNPLLRHDLEQFQCPKRL